MVIPASWMGFQAYCTYDKYIYIIYVYIYMIYIWYIYIYIIYIYISYIYIIYLYIISYIYISYIYISYTHNAKTNTHTHTHHFKPWLQQWGAVHPSVNSPGLCLEVWPQRQKKVPLETLGLKGTSIAFIWEPWGYSGGSLICLPGILQITHQLQKHPDFFWGDSSW